MNWNPEVQADGKGLPPPDKEALGADGLGVVLLIVSCFLEVTFLNPQGYYGKEKNHDEEVNMTT